MLNGCAAIVERRGQMITNNCRFITAPDNSTFRELWKIHLKNVIFMKEGCDEKLKQVRKGF